LWHSNHKTSRRNILPRAEGNRAERMGRRPWRPERQAGREPLSDEQFEGLLDLVVAEEQDVITAYRLELDQKTMTRAACLGRLGPTRDDLWMDRRGVQLRQAIDRKQWVIIGLLQTLGLTRRSAPEAADDTGGETGNGAVEQGQTAPSLERPRGAFEGSPSPPVKKLHKQSQEVIWNQQKSAKNKAKTNPNKAKLRRRSVE
jgi:hypothetical protein